MSEGKRRDHRPTVQELFDLSGRVALVTGATGWLGSAFAEALAEAGARVVVSSRDGARAEAAAAELPRPAGVEHVGVELDQLDPATIESGFAAALEATGQVDILVSNGHSWLLSDWTDVSAEQFSRQMDNATGYFLLARRMREDLVRRDAGGSIILVGSMYGVVGLVSRRLRRRRARELGGLPRGEGRHRPHDPPPGRLLGEGRTSASTA